MLMDVVEVTICVQIMLMLPEPALVTQVIPQQPEAILIQDVIVSSGVSYFILRVIH